APAPHDRGRRVAWGGVRGSRGGDARDLFAGGEGVNAEAGTSGSAAGASPGEGSGRPSDEELRAAYEAELSRITSVDMIAQAVVSLLSIGARRLGPVGPEAGEGAGPAVTIDCRRVRPGQTLAASDPGLRGF